MEDRNESQTTNKQTNKQTKNNYPVHKKAEYFSVKIQSYPHCVLWSSWMAVLGQNIRTGSREVKIDSIECFVVVLTPWPADAISVLPLVSYWEENSQFIQTRPL